MKVIVLGAGLMGKEATRDLLQNPAVEKVTLADIDIQKAMAVATQLQSKKLDVSTVDASSVDQLTQLLQPYDVVINALFYAFNENVAKAAIASQTSSVDLGGHIGHVTDKVLALDEEAKDADITIIPDLGVAPGMINILAGYGVAQLDEATDIALYVGGIPLQPDPPLGYNHVFSMEGLFDHYTDPSLIIRDGVKQEIPSLSEIETLYFEKFGPLEAFHTAGGTSTLSLSYPNLQSLYYKTIRYPGHAEKFQLLVDLNLTRDDVEITLNGQNIKPREVFLKVLDPIVDLREKEDVVLLRVEVSGIKEGKPKTLSFELAAFMDTINKVTAMARTTAYTISTVAQMIGSGNITKRGVYAPENIVDGALYIEEMKKRGVEIKTYSL